MAEGTNEYRGLAVPLHGSSEIHATSATPDVLTLTGYAAQSGDYFVCQTQNGTEEFVVANGGGLTASGAASFTSTLTVATGITATAGDVTVTAGDVQITTGYYLRFTAVPTCTPITGLTLGDTFLLKTSSEYQIAICDDTTQNTLRYINTTST